MNSNLLTHALIVRFIKTIVVFYLCVCFIYLCGYTTDYNHCVTSSYTV